MIRLDWALPTPPNTKPIAGTRILFPASALARKGAYEMRRLAQELNLDLVITGHATEEAGFWSDVKVTQATGDLFSDIQLVVYPAYIEHRPKLLLKAIAAGVPVIATEACGIAAQAGITNLPTGNYQALKEAAILALQISHEAVSI